jgi:predicted SprT family Zn-dependent metalloprotease
VRIYSFHPTEETDRHVYEYYCDECGVYFKRIAAKRPFRVSRPPHHCKHCMPIIYQDEEFLEEMSIQDIMKPRRM